MDDRNESLQIDISTFSNIDVLDEETACSIMNHPEKEMCLYDKTTSEKEEDKN